MPSPAAPHAPRSAWRWLRRRVRRRTRQAEPAHFVVGQWSDGDLVRAWHRSDTELRSCAGRTAGRTLTVVMWRATLLDELDRRGLTPAE